MRSEPGATGRKANGQEREHTQRRRQKREPQELLPQFLPMAFDRLTTVQQEDPMAAHLNHPW